MFTAEPPTAEAILISSPRAGNERLNFGGDPDDHRAPATPAEARPMRTEPTGLDGVVLTEIEIHRDRRGWLGEVYRADQADHRPAMAYVSCTEPGVARGPHEHLYQTDLFVFAGPGDLEIYLYDNRPESPTRGARWSGVRGQTRPATLLVPPRVIHAYRCVSAAPAWILNLPDKLYRGCGREAAVDEIRHEAREDSPFYSAFDRKLFAQ